MSGTLRLPEFNHDLDRIAPAPLVQVRLEPADPTVWCKLDDLNPGESASIAMTLASAHIGLSF